MDRKQLLESLSNEIEYFVPVYQRKFSRPLATMGTYRFTALQRMTLVFLLRNGPSRMRTIADFLGVSKQQTTTLIETLEKQHFVVRRVNTDNRREILVFTTKKGEDFFTMMRKEALQGLMAKMSPLSDDEIQEIIRDIHTIDGYLAKLKDE